jgi:hypothetical protein
MFTQKINLRFVKPHHFRRQQEDGVIIDFFMTIKTPGECK